jgi:hypothetical protein
MGTEVVSGAFTGHDRVVPSVSEAAMVILAAGVGWSGRGSGMLWG